MILKTIGAAVAATTFMLGAAHAATFTANGSEADANAARANWEAAVGGVFSEDDLTGISGSGTVTSAAGNTFTATAGTLGASTRSIGVLDGSILLTGTIGGIATYTWNIVSPAVSAIGFNGYDNDTGTVTLNFNNGTAQEFSLATSGNSLSLFFGITDINPGISSVSISTTDNGTTTGWDNFVYATAAAPVPVPASVLMLAGGLGVMGFVGRRRKKPALA